MPDIYMPAYKRNYLQRWEFQWGTKYYPREGEISKAMGTRGKGRGKMQPP